MLILPTSYFYYSTLKKSIEEALFIKSLIWYVFKRTYN